ncbi:hypothetical protein [Nocardia gipuzkoensis]
MTDKVAEFKQQLRDLVEQAKAAGAGKQVKLAREAHMAGATVSRSIGPSYPLPTRGITRDLVTVCLHFIHPDLPPDQLEKKLRWWLDQREEAARHAQSSCTAYDPLPGQALEDGAAVLVRKIADVRYAVMSALFRYLDLAERMWEFEKAFEEQILRSRSDLLLRRAQRERLEAGYRDIQLKMRSGELDVDEIEKEVAAALESSDLVGTDLIGGMPALTLADTPIGSLGSDDDNLDKATRERIRRTFKRIVLARVHPDTSDAELSEFEVALAALRSEDYTLMEAFTIRYQDDIVTDEGGERLTLAQLTTRLQNYQDALKRLEIRLIALERTAASIGMNALDASYDRMRREGDRLRMEITVEVERIREVESELRSLVESAPDAGSDDGAALPDTDDTDQPDTAAPNSSNDPVEMISTTDYDGSQR